jgi:hypothetical protein
MQQQEVHKRTNRRSAVVSVSEQWPEDEIAIIFYLNDVLKSDCERFVLH